MGAIPENGRTIPCPVPGYDQKHEDGRPVYYVIIPGEWLLEHEDKKERAVKMAKEAGITSDTAITLLVSLDLARDWNLPHLTGKPENWDLSKYPLRLTAWINRAVWGDFNNCYVIPPNWLKPLPNGLMAVAKTKQPGDLETAVSSSDLAA